MWAQIEAKAAFCLGNRPAADLVGLVKKSNSSPGPRQKRSGSEPCQAATYDYNLGCRTHIFFPPIPITFERRKTLQLGLSCCAFGGEALHITGAADQHQIGHCQI